MNIFATEAQDKGIRREKFSVTMCPRNRLYRHREAPLKNGIDFLRADRPQSHGLGRPALHAAGAWLGLTLLAAMFLFSRAAAAPVPSGPAAKSCHAGPARPERRDLSGGEDQRPRSRSRDYPGEHTGGSQRVDGAEARLNGRVTSNWQVIAGYTYLDSKVTKTAPGAAPVGAPLMNTPRHGLTFWSV